MTEHERLRTELGAYLIGSLAPAERAAVDRHLATCADCRGELAALAPLPGLLGRLTTDQARTGSLTPAPELLTRTLAAVRAERRTEHGQLRRWQWAAVGAAVAAVAAAVVLVLPAPGTAAPAVPLVAVAASTATGTGSLNARPWGTAVDLDLHGLPPAAGYRAYAVSRDGRDEIAATWGRTSDGRAVLTGATAIPRAHLAAVQIRTADGRTLLTLPA